MKSATDIRTQSLFPIQCQKEKPVLGGFTVGNAKVEAMKARLFARLREYFQTAASQLWRKLVTVANG